MDGEIQMDGDEIFFEYMLREQKTSLNRLIKMGVSAEVEAEILAKLQVIEGTLKEK